MFQSTRPRGARHLATAYSEITPTVSIHTPAWGATSTFEFQVMTYCCFNPHARVGRDRMILRLRHINGLFQSTRPRGARLPKLLLADLNSLVSIHTPAWGATSAQNTCRDIISFNPHARVGRDKMYRGGTQINNLFQSTRPRGARHKDSATIMVPLDVSIHTPAWGATGQARC